MSNWTWLEIISQKNFLITFTFGSALVLYPRIIILRQYKLMTLSALSSQIIISCMYEPFSLPILPCITSINIIITSLQIGFHKLWSLKSVSELILILEAFLLF